MSLSKTFSWPGLSPCGPLVIFGFGLLHGLGICNPYWRIRPPGEDQFIPALIGFSTSVEVGSTDVNCNYFPVCSGKRLRRDLPGQGRSRAAKGCMWALAVICIGAVCIHSMPCGGKRLLEATGCGCQLAPMTAIATEPEYGGRSGRLRYRNLPELHRQGNHP